MLALVKILLSIRRPLILNIIIKKITASLLVLQNST